MYKPLLHKRASKYYESLEDNIARKVNKAIVDMTKNPFKGRHIKRLRGKLEGKYRYAVGDLRIVYIINADKRMIRIEAIGPRGDVYK